MPILRVLAVAACVAALLPAPVLAQDDPKLCAEIADSQARLKCFDSLFPSASAEAAWRSQPVPVRRVRTQRITADAPAAPEPGSVLERLIGTQ